ncbi:hypothetical protein MUN84_06740 [Hymenobacter sp. 5516J-16]|uniref:Integral membrane protein n=1 Tax=Hymenobacter sublimis TaxID=2933777 RepID=A0ABY4J8X5_9BACT|nr:MULTISPECIES: hypothetical protein [Hymenobacter]UOQ78275.1 hypothetical protein MUN84_06740 [Hymenobacter sp. 5516J-16]UPL48257.1 hypothetical protein MWH26_13795 [Hymenobacter sublimis]
MNYYLLVYGVYLPTTVLLTVWVARTLFKNGRTFLVDIFHGNEPLADSVNKLLLTGFYLINIGYATLTLRSTDAVTSYQQSVETLSIKIGTIILILGGMHFFNLYVFYKLRNRAQEYARAYHS